MPFDLVPVQQPQAFDLVPVKAPQGDAKRAALAGLANSIPNVLGAAGDITSAINDAGDFVTRKLGMEPIEHAAAEYLPTSQRIRTGLGNALDFAGTPDDQNAFRYQPQTQTDKLAYQTTAAINPVAPVAGAVAGAGGEGLRQTFEGTPLEGAAQVVGNIGGALIGNKVDGRIMPSPPPNLGNAPQDANQAFSRVAGDLRAEHQGLSQRVNDAYTALRDSGDRGVAMVPAATERLTQMATGALQKGAYDLRADGMKDVVRLSQDLSDFAARRQPATVGELNDWRTRLTQAAQDARGTSAGAALNAMRRSFDEWEGGVQGHELWNGTPEQFAGFANARSLRAELGQRFPDGGLAIQAVDPAVTPETVRGMFFGKSSPGAVDDGANRVAEAMKAAGGRADGVRDSLAKGMVHQMMEKNGYADGSLRYGGLANDINSVTARNRSLAEALLSPEMRQTLSQAAADASVAGQSGGLLRRMRDVGAGGPLAYAGYQAGGIPGAALGAAPLVLSEARKALSGSSAERRLAQVLAAVDGKVPAAKLSDAQKRALAAAMLTTTNTQER